MKISGSKKDDSRPVPRRPEVLLRDPRILEECSAGPARRVVGFRQREPQRQLPLGLRTRREWPARRRRGHPMWIGPCPQSSATKPWVFLSVIARSGGLSRFGFRDGEVDVVEDPFRQIVGRSPDPTIDLLGPAYAHDGSGDSLSGQRPGHCE